MPNGQILREGIIMVARQWLYQRWIILIHYGGDPPKCACCGETRYEFLSIDHINGGGNEERKKFLTTTGKYNPRKFYQWLIDNNFPEGFRVLCMNCNFALGHYGYCPHSGKTVQIPDDLEFRIQNNNRLSTPSSLPSNPRNNFHKLKWIKDCKNCGREYKDTNGFHHFALGFCSIKCHKEWHEKEKNNVNR
jgi:hypothetical protein